MSHVVHLCVFKKHVYKFADFSYCDSKGQPGCKISKHPRRRKTKNVQKIGLIVQPVSANFVFLCIVFAGRIVCLFSRVVFCVYSFFGGCIFSYLFYFYYALVCFCFLFFCICCILCCNLYLLYLLLGFSGCFYVVYSPTVWTHLGFLRYSWAAVLRSLGRAGVDG